MNKKAKRIIICLIPIVLIMLIFLFCYDPNFKVVSSNINAYEAGCTTYINEHEVIQAFTANDIDNSIISSVDCTEKTISVEIEDVKSPAKVVEVTEVKKQPEAKTVTKEEEEEVKLPSVSRNILFAKDAKGKYNYAPSCMYKDGKLNLWFCENAKSYVVKDSIYYVECTIKDDFSYYTVPTSVLKSSKDSWDSMHVCDPSVCEGNFSYNGTTYKYIMAYLGCSSTDNQDNEIGVAVSNSLSSGWIKCNNAPLISYEHDYSHPEFQWGVGQPSVINLEDSKVLIFYTKGTYNLTSEEVRLYDLSDISNPVLISEATISNNGTNDFISNADFALYGNTLYMVCDKHPFENGVLNCIADDSNIFKTNLTNSSSGEEIINDLRNVTWEKVITVDVFDKDHNMAFVRDCFGNSNMNAVIESIADEKGNFSDSLFTYELRLTDVNLHN